MNIELVPMRSDNYTFLIRESGSRRAWLVDPSTEDIVDYCLSRQLSIQGILITHHHYDHVGGNAACVKEWGCPVYASQFDKDRISEITHTVEEGDRVQVFSEEFTVLETPGHTLGAVCYVSHGLKCVFVGDTLFSMGCGRMFEGNPGQFLQSLHKILSLPGDYKIYCGHEYTEANARFTLSLGEPDQDLQDRIHEVRNLRLKGEPTIPTTVELEWKTNPFVQMLKHNGMTQSAIHQFKHLRGLKDQF